MPAADPGAKERQRREKDERRCLADDGSDLPQFLAALSSEPTPQMVALSLSFQWRAADVLALAVALRERGFRGHITAGGHFASFAWQELLTDFAELDSICRFESEHTLCELVEAVLGRGVDASGHPAWWTVPGLARRGPDGVPVLAPARRPPAPRAGPPTPGWICVSG